jgi:hypothetical protein
MNGAKYEFSWISQMDYLDQIFKISFPNFYSIDSNKDYEIQVLINA